MAADRYIYVCVLYLVYFICVYIYVYTYLQPSKCPDIGRHTVNNEIYIHLNIYVLYMYVYVFVLNRALFHVHSQFI